MSEGHDLPEGPALPERGRWLIVGGLALLALPVVFSFSLFALVAAEGCLADCSAPDPQPWLAAALIAGAAVMGGGWAGLVPWALGRPLLIARTFLAGAGVVALVVGALAVLG